MRYLLIGLGVLLVLAAFVFFGILPQVVAARMNTFTRPPPYDASNQAERLHEGLFVADLHNDLLLWGRDPLERHDYGHTDVPRLVEGNVALQVFSVVTQSPSGQNYENNPSDSDRLPLLAVAQRWPLGAWFSFKGRALHQARKLRDAAERSAGRLTLIETRADLERFLVRRDREPDILAGLLAMEGMHALEGDLANLQVFYDVGYRMMGPTHFIDNEVAGSAHGVERGGLTELGRRAVRQAEELGILLDLAHLSPRAIQEILAMANRPVVVSHTGVKGTCEGPRNLSDQEIRGVAATGGIIGIGFWTGAVCDESVQAIVDAIRYTADLVGVEHVALGSDFDGSVHTPFDASGLVLLTEGLLEAGFTRHEIAMVMGDNVRRLLLEVLPE
jgi:microsomal dipeptidase-like Zn-dependent dipeptidase